MKFLGYAEGEVVCSDLLLFNFMKERLRPD